MASAGCPRGIHANDDAVTTVILRVDGGPAVGLGHLTRCVALSAALAAEGARPLFVLRADPTVEAWLAEHGVAREVLAPALAAADDARVTAAAVGREGAAAVVVDWRGADKEYLSTLVASGPLVVSIDDLAEPVFPSHLVVNGNLFARDLFYRADRSDTRFLLGPDYAMLRPDFWAVPARPVRDGVERVLVTVGGRNRRGLLPRVLQALDGVPGDFTVVVASGPFAGATDMRPRRRLEVLAAPAALPAAMREADVAVTGGGQTVYELACVGCPAVVLRSADDQEEHLRAIARAGVALVPADADDVTEVARLVGALAADRATRARLAAVGRRLVDGQGARRVARAILEMVAGRQAAMKPRALVGEKLYLRPLEKADATDEYLAWLHNPEVTRWLETGRFATTLDQLRAYLGRFDGGTHHLGFAIIDRATGLHVGNATLNNINWVHRTADTGLMIGRKEFWGKGYAFEAWSLVIEYAFERLNLRKVIAGVIPENEASWNVLRRLGFQVEGTLRAHVWAAGAYRDSVRLGMLRDEFYKFARGERT